ncbi:MAG: hypothetical protein AAFO72_08200 [Pseudomonadota bacterium]
MKKIFLVAVALAMSVSTARADDIMEALESAMQAYEDGDTQYAIEELDFAKQLLQAMKTDELVQFLPEAPDGWTREVNTEMNAGLAFMGGGSGAEATYDGGGQSITITMMADNPMVAGIAGMIGNAALLGAKIERVGRQKFMVQDGEISGLVDNRIMIQASGGDVDTMLEMLETMDFRALSKFGT